MNIWDVLEIKQTKDKDKIKKAYRSLLLKTNPEDNPEGFMELRKAYEEAVGYADAEAMSIPDNKEEGLEGKLSALYQDFKRRIDDREWTMLFDEDEFVALETSEKAFTTLMKFLMDHFYLPKMVWKVICDTFDIQSSRKDLKGTFPDDFIDYMVNNSIYEDVIDYSLFEGDECEYDRYIELYYKLDIAVRKRDVCLQEELLEKLMNLDVYHPYIEIAKIRHEIQKLVNSEEGDNTDILLELQARANSLYEAYNEDISIINCCGDVALFREDYEQAGKFYGISSKLAPENYIVKGKLAELYYYTGEYEKSRDLYMELLKINHYDNNVRAGMLRANQGIIEQHKKQLEGEPDNNKLRIEMAWSYYQSYKFDEAIKLLDEFSPDSSQVFEYNNLKGRNFLCIEEYEKALKCFFEWKKAIEELDAEDKNTADKRKRYEYVNFLIGDCYLKLDDYSSARKYLDIAMSKEHEEIVLSYEAYCELEYKCGNMEECLNACDRLLELEPRSYIAYDYMSKAYYKMGYVHETLGACERAISIYPYVCIPYETEINILINIEQYAAAKNVLERYRGLKLESDRMDLLEAKLYEKEDINTALKLTKELDKRANENDSDMEEIADIKKYLGDLYEKTGEVDKAIRIYEELANNKEVCLNVYGRLGMLYRSKKEIDRSIECFSKEIEINECSYYLAQRAILYKYQHKIKLAQADYERAIKLDGGDYFVHSRLGLIYEQLDEFEKAIVEYNCATEAIKGENEYDTGGKNSKLLLWKARCYQCMKQFEKSEVLYKAYIEAYGITADVTYDYAELLSRLDRADEAIRILKKSIETLPYDDSLQRCIRQLIVISGNEGYIDMANEAFLLAIDKKKDDAWAYASIASVLKLHDLYKEAAVNYEKAIEYSGNDDNFYNELMEVLYLGRSAKKISIEKLSEAANLSETELKIPYYMLKLVKRYIAKKEYEKAVDLVNRIFDVNRCAGCFYGRCHEALFEKGRICERLKKYELARQYYEEAAEVCGHNCLYEDKIKGIDKNDSRN